MGLELTPLRNSPKLPEFHLAPHKTAAPQKAGRIGTSPLKRFAWSSQRKTVKRLYNGPTNIRVFSDLMRSVGLMTQSYLS